MSTLFQQAGETQIRQAEWSGATSAKFTTNKRHVNAPQPNQDGAHPLFSMGGRKHYDPQASKEAQWKPSLKVEPNKDAPRPEKVSGVKYLNPTFGENLKPRPERKHTENGAQTFKTYEDAPVGKGTFVMHNRKTVDEVPVTKQMGSKKRVGTIFEARNGLPMAALGDKNYKTPMYQPGYFSGGGLIPGST